MNLLDTDSSTYDASVRLGFMENNEDSIVTANNAFGFGAQDASDDGVGCGAACYPGATYHTTVQGTMWVLPAEAVPTERLFSRGRSGAAFG